MIGSLLVLVLLGLAAVPFWIAWWLVADLFGRDRMTRLTDSPNDRPQEHIESMTWREGARTWLDDMKPQRESISSLGSKRG